MADRITDLLARQAYDLAAMQDGDAARVLRLAIDARRELRERLDALVTSGEASRTRYTAQHLRVMLAQTEQVVITLRQRLDATLQEGKQAAARGALRDTLHTIRAHQEEFRDTGNRIELDAIRRMSADQGLLLHRYSIDRYGAAVVEKVQQELSVALFQGQTLRQVAQRITSVDGAFQAQTWRAQLIARMEISKAYNDGHQASLEAASEVLDDPGTDDPLLRQANEFLDTRNHPISRVIDGMVSGIRTPWLVSVAEVRAEGDRIKKSPSGVLWPEVGGQYVCGGYPLHFGERGRSVPYRASWDDGAALKGITSKQAAQLPEALRQKIA